MEAGAYTKGLMPLLRCRPLRMQRRHERGSARDAGLPVDAVQEELRRADLETGSYRVTEAASLACLPAS